MKFENASKLIFDRNSCVNLRPKYLIAGYVFVSLFILLIPMILRCKSVEFSQTYINAMCNHVLNIHCNLDWWSVTHFVFYIVLGFVFPHLWFILIILGITWEILEFCMSKIERKWFTTTYWRGRWSDLIINTLGFIVGVLLRYGFTLLCC